MSTNPQKYLPESIAPKVTVTQHNRRYASTILVALHIRLLHNRSRVYVNPDWPRLTVRSDSSVARSVNVATACILVAMLDHAEVVRGKCALRAMPPIPQ